VRRGLFIFRIVWHRIPPRVLLWEHTECRKCFCTGRRVQLCVSRERSRNVWSWQPVECLFQSNRGYSVTFVIEHTCHSWVDSADCKFTCRGDSSEFCRGDWRLNMYTFGDPSQASSTSTSTPPAATSALSTSRYSSRSDQKEYPACVGCGLQMPICGLEGSVHILTNDATLRPKQAQHDRMRLLSPDESGILQSVAFFSRSLTPPECNYDIYSKELMTVVHALEDGELSSREQELQWRSSAITNVFIIHNDQASHCRQARLSGLLSRFNFKLIYLPGAQGARSDVLIRRSSDLPQNEEDEDTSPRINNPDPVSFPSECYQAPLTRTL
jgi:hypothetical protein